MTILQAVASRFDPRLRRALKNLYDEWRIWRNHCKGVRYLQRNGYVHESLRVHFGCGPERKQGWLNTDMWPGPWARPDVCLDVRRQLPFASGSVAEVYCEHLLEHLEYPSEVQLFLTECFRVLRVGGVMHIGVPDLDIIYAHFMDQKFSNELLQDHYILGHPLEELNYCFHQGSEHKFLYNEEFLVLLLQRFGFSNVRRRLFDPGLDSETRRGGTLYVVGEKRVPSRANGSFSHH